MWGCEDAKETDSGERAFSPLLEAGETTGDVVCPPESLNLGKAVTGLLLLTAEVPVDETF